MRIKNEVKTKTKNKNPSNIHFLYYCYKNNDIDYTKN